MVIFPSEKSLNILEARGIKMHYWVPTETMGQTDNILLRTQPANPYRVTRG